MDRYSWVAVKIAVNFCANSSVIVCHSFYLEGFGILLQQAQYTYSSSITIACFRLLATRIAQLSSFKAAKMFDFPSLFLPGEQ